MTSEFVNADGTRTTVQYTEANFDGKDYPLTGSQFGADTVSLKRIDTRTTERTDKKGSTVVQTLLGAASGARPAGPSSSMLECDPCVSPGSTHVRDVGLQAADDDAVWAHAPEQGFVIVSKDADFRQRRKPGVAMRSGFSHGRE